jgi:His Kinase A (phospho-acceptor) domain
MQRLEAVGQLTSGVAHDFNNLLTVVLGNLTFVEKGINTADSGLKQRLSYMRLAAERGAKLTAQLLAFSRAQRLEPKAINLNDALANMRDLLQSSLGGGVQINTLFRPRLWYAFADRRRNLCRNLCRSSVMPSGEPANIRSASRWSTGRATVACLPSPSGGAAQEALRTPRPPRAVPMPRRVRMPANAASRKAWRAFPAPQAQRWRSTADRMGGLARRGARRSGG